MNIQVNDAGIIINSMGHPLDARKVCEAYNELCAALQDLNSHASHAENLIAELAVPGASEYFREIHVAQIAARAALAKAQQ